ncbi:MAG: VOC family protein [Bacteroidetes bacterium]|nr:VOC family protein [Bacteroidota bacterium]MBU1371500.1 VOC family protein [Bacteroidota bacterium]MBU1485730.1 VOC family protein [Bacteroidota bacterium]MBU1761835.1 VOC family protein [Bacteroidota bacterium]MBU2045395.1 VOC family protein [Bacteroidota bacterium]
MTKLDPIIAVKNVEASVNWYQQVFGFKNLHSGENFAVLATENEDIILCLHKWGEHEHPSLTDQTTIAGNGLLLYFRTDNMENIRNKIDKIGSLVVEEIHLNTNSLRKEFSIRDLDGYFIVVTEFHIYEG